jgi:adenylate cyclase
MVTQGVKRKLTAILSADVKGYSRLMEEDEAATVKTLTAYRETISSLIQQHRGRVVDSPGDNLLAEFASVVDAVQCAVETQELLKAKNAELPEDRRMQFRFGINLGDVIEEGNRIYGDGVNIASRIEALADPGGICIAMSVYNQIKKKLVLDYEDMGEHTVKNIAEPIRVYRVPLEPRAGAVKVGAVKKAKLRRWQWAALAVAMVIIIVAGALVIQYYVLHPAPIEPVSVEKLAFPFPEKPSIAVLPFVNMSDDPEQDYLSDGITEDIISSLSKIRNLFVIARNSTFTYKGKPVKVHQVAEELGVRYVLEGSVQKAGNRVRITAQLVDAVTGRHMWAERYDRELKDLFALQDNITREIVTALQVELTEGEQARVWAKSTKNMESWTYVNQGLKYYRLFTKKGVAQARQMLERAVELDPDNAFAYSWLGWTHWMDARWGWSASRAQSFQHANELAQKAIALNNSLATAHNLLGAIYLLKREHQKAIAEAELAVTLFPNGADVNATFGWILTYSGRPEEGIRYLKHAMRLSPTYEDWYLAALGLAYWLTRQYDEAISTYKLFRRRNPDQRYSYVGLAKVYAELGREKEARAEMAEALRVDPKLSLERAAKSYKIFKNPEDLQRALDAYRKAGLK